MLENHILQNTQIAFSLDFNTPLDRKKLAQKVSNITRRDVSYSDTYSYHNINESNILVTRNDVGGRKMCKLQAPLMPYAEARLFMLECFDLIAYLGYTSNKCNVRTYVKFNTGELGITNVDKINRVKLNSAVDECVNCSEWFSESGMTNDYLSSLSFIVPKDISVLEASDIKDVANFYSVKSSGKSIIDQDLLTKGVVSIKANIGKDYEKKKNILSSYLDKTIKAVYEVLKFNDEYTLTEKAKISRILKRHKQMYETIKDYDTFEKKTSNYITYDCKSNKDMIKSLYDKEIKYKLFELLTYTDINLSIGNINYHPENGRLQIANCKIRNGFIIEGIEFANCNMSGEFKDCTFNGCVLKDSILQECKLYNNNNIESSTVNETAFHGVGNIAQNVYITNSPDLLVECELIRCVVKGTVYYGSKVDIHTEVLN